jgi:WXG100 family type VII secretion target
MTTTSVDHAAHAAATKHMADQVPALRSAAQQLQATVDASHSGWQGTAQAAFVQFHGRLHGQLTSLHRHLDELSQTLGQGNKILGAADDEGSQPFTNLA